MCDECRACCSRRRIQLMCGRHPCEKPSCTHSEARREKRLRGSHCDAVAKATKKRLLRACTQGARNRGAGSLRRCV